MTADNQKKIIDNLIQEIADNYSLTRSIVENHLCESLSEVMSDEIGYRVDVGLNEGKLLLTGRKKQNGIEKDFELSLKRIKIYHLERIEAILKKKLDISETNPILIKYRQYQDKIVYGTIIRKNNDRYYVLLNDIKDGAIGVCELFQMRPIDRGNAIGKRLFFYVLCVKTETISERTRVIFYLSRTVKKFPSRLLYEIISRKEKTDDLQIVCKKWVVGHTCYIKSNKFIKKGYIKSLEKLLTGEIISLFFTGGKKNG